MPRADLSDQFLTDHILIGLAVPFVEIWDTEPGDRQMASQDPQLTALGHIPKPDEPVGPERDQPITVRTEGPTIQIRYYFGESAITLVVVERV